MRQAREPRNEPGAACRRRAAAVFARDSFSPEVVMFVPS